MNNDADAAADGSRGDAHARAAGTMPCTATTEAITTPTTSCCCQDASTPSSTTTAGNSKFGGTVAGGAYGRARMAVGGAPAASGSELPRPATTRHDFQGAAPTWRRHTAA